jgi:RND family efflux transporter MFP subunit
MNDTMVTQSAAPSQRPINWRAIAIAVLLAVLGIAGYLGWPRGAPPAAAAPRPKLTVTVVTPKRMSLPQRLTASGVIAPWQEASIGTQIGSYQLIDVRVNVGDQVRRGEVLARLNPALLRAEEAQLLARHAQAEANDRRARGLQDNGAISDQEVLQFATEAKTASALLAAKRLELRYTAVLAPDDGVITARTATLGAVVPSGQELFRMIRKNRLEWRGELTAAQLNAVAEGQRIALVLPDGSRAGAVIRQTAPALDAGSRLAIVYADLAPGSRARAGMYVTGEITFGASPAVVVPAECIVIRDGRSYVLQVAGTAATPQVALRGVTTGRREGETVEILRGLGGGERLVLSGAGFLGDGDVVRIAGAREAGR